MDYMSEITSYVKHSQRKFRYLLLMVCFILSKVGDPLEKAAIKDIDWIYTSDEKAISKK